MDTFVKKQILLEPGEFRDRIKMGEVFQIKLNNRALVMEAANGEEVIIREWSSDPDFDWYKKIDIDPQSPGKVCPTCNGKGRI